MCKRVGAGLYARGLRKGDVVALNLSNTTEYVPSCLAPMAMGSVVTFLPTQFTSTEIEDQLKDCSPKVVICDESTLQQSLEGSLNAGVPKESIFYVGDEAIAAAHGIESFHTLAGFPSTAMPDVNIACFTDTAIMPYSSGTTGKPKGVELTHGNVGANLKQFDVCGPSTATSLLGLLPFYHIYGFMLGIAHVSDKGHSMAILDKFDPAVFLKTLMTEKIAVAHLVPPLIIFLAKHPIVEKFDLSALKRCYSGAAPLGNDVANQFAERLKVDISQGYGMSELSPVSHSFTFGEAGAPGASVGFTVSNTESLIVDIETGEPIPKSKPNTRGELWVRGPQVMKGYFNRPQQTAQTMEGEWLKTGDIAQVDEQGRFYVVDRLKELIKYKGHQIAPAELEDVILSSEDVADAAVVSGSDAEGEEIPLAFVVKRDGSEITEDLIMKFVAAKVAPYKKVREVRFIDVIPKAASGKILRRVLKSHL